MKPGADPVHGRLEYYHCARVDLAGELAESYTRAAMATAGEALMRLGMTPAESSARCADNLREAVFDNESLRRVLS